MKYTCFILFVLLFSSCLAPNQMEQPASVVPGTINSTDSIKIIDINIPKLEEMNIDKYLSDVNYIPLETSRKSMIGEISKIYYYQKKFYILDKISSSILVFNENGKFNLKIDKNGKGPGEYRKISDFQIDRSANQIVILCDTPLKIIRYSLSGKLVSEFLVPCYTRHFAVLPDSTFAMYLEYGSNASKMEKEYNLIITDKAGKIARGFQPFDSKSISDRFSKPKIHFYNSNGKIYYYPDLMDTIYRVEKEIITPVFAFNFGENAFNKQILNQSIKEQDNYFSNTNYCHFYSIQETQDVLHFYIANASIMYNCYYSKKTSDVIISAIPTSEKHILGQVVGSDDNSFIGEINQITMISKQNKINNLPQLDKNLYNIVKNYDVSNNPVLVTYRINL